MEKLSYSVSDDVLLVKVSFNKKQAFKSVFSSAKWNVEHKAWELNKRLKNKLEQYIEKANKAIEIHEEEEALSLSVSELRELDYKIESAKELLAELREKHGDLEKVNTLLEKKKEKFVAISTEIKQYEDAIQSEKDSIKSKISAVIDIDKVLSLRDEMAKNAGRRYGSEGFHAAQSELEVIYNTLKANGLKSKGLVRLTEMNFNRPDRDKPADVSLDSILNISEIN